MLLSPFPQPAEGSEHNFSWRQPGMPERGAHRFPRQQEPGGGNAGSAVIHRCWKPSFLPFSVFRRFLKKQPAEGLQGELLPLPHCGWRCQRRAHLAGGRAAARGEPRAQEEEEEEKKKAPPHPTPAPAAAGRCEEPGRCWRLRRWAWRRWAGRRGPGCPVVRLGVTRGKG